MKNNYGLVLNVLVIAHKPKLVIEMGVLDGFSTCHIANALKFNHQRGIESQFFAYDLWDSYDYKHGNFHEVEEMLSLKDLNEFVYLKRGDAFEVAGIFEKGSVDFLHMDISNDGDKLIKTLEVWGDKLSVDGIIAFEGGNTDRDLGWIKKYGYKPILPTLDEIKGWDFQIFKPFPGLILLWKKNEFHR